MFVNIVAPSAYIKCITQCFQLFYVLPLFFIYQVPKIWLFNLFAFYHYSSYVKFLRPGFSTYMNSNLFLGTLFEEIYINSGDMSFLGAALIWSQYQKAFLKCSKMLGLFDLILFIILGLIFFSFSKTVLIFGTFAIQLANF